MNDEIRVLTLQETFRPIAPDLYFFKKLIINHFQESLI